MKIILLITSVLLLVVSCVQMPLKKVHLGANIHTFALHERQQKIDYISIRNNGDRPINIADHPVTSPKLQNSNWSLSISTRLEALTDVEMVEFESWARQYEQAMKVLAENIRPSTYELTIVPMAVTYRSQVRKKFNSSLLPISFVFSVPADSTARATFQRVFSILSHEQYHIHQRLDIEVSPLDIISSEALTSFVSSCVSNTIFTEVSDPGDSVPSIGEYILGKPTRDELRTAMAVNAKTEDVIQNNLAGKLVVRYLFDILMEKSTKDPDKFSAELNDLCRAFGANTPTTWEGLLDLYIATKSNNDH